ncbi:MAG: hypothetical protein ACFFDW_09860 [Candidatus Thorarchaeota archaeon]
MALTTFTWLYLIISSISAVINLLLYLLLFANFLRRKTIGTMILSLSFLATAIGEVMFSLSFWFQSFVPTISLEISGVIYYVGMAILSLNTYFYYFFGNRYIIKDNDLTKSVIALAFCITVGLTIGLGSYYILHGIDMPGVCVYGNLAESELVMFIIGYLLAIPLVPTSVFLVFGRITIKGITMIRYSKDVITKKGLTFVLIASILHILGAASRTIFYWFAGIRVRPILSIVIFSIGVITTIIALTLYYLGWVMPDWLKRRFREQAWFTKIYVGKIAPPIEKSTSTTTGYSINNIVEINEK